MIRNNGTKDISTKWLSDLKSGFCKTQFYMNKERFSIGQIGAQPLVNSILHSDWSILENSKRNNAVGQILIKDG